MEKLQEIKARIKDDTRGIRPHYERYSLLSAARTFEELLGGESGGLAEELGLNRAEKVVTFLMDGVGLERLEALRREGVVDLSRFSEDGAYIPLTSVFPSTTTTALTSLSTGASPLAHGVLGYTLFLGEVGAIVNMIKLAPPGAPSDSLEKLGVELATFVPVSTVYQRLEAIGVPSYLFLPKFIMDSGLSQILYKGIRKTIPYLSLSDLFWHLRTALARPGRALLAVYWPTVDALAHLYGPGSPAVTSEIGTFFRLLEEEFLSRARGATVLLMADHGFVDTDPKEDVVSCPEHPVLREGLLFPPVGDARAAYLFVRRGREGEVKEYLEEHFPGEFLILETEEALAQGLWGLERPTQEFRARLGDLVVAARGRRLLLWPREEFRLRGMHGGITEQELLVPFLALKLA